MSNPTCEECEQLHDALLTSEAGRRVEARYTDRLEGELQEMRIQYDAMRRELEEYRAGRIAA